ncbi:enzymatic polyprotein [Labeo rohita]|uniref:Enzymatic polyprotein n=1 Tax=Labeo rohita TaxID=84645 RepID=A0ABQ8LSP6_LABRO|nr:enzymatic polyprotein [Labeo rohita]
MAAVSNVIPFGLLFMRPLQWCLKTKGVLPEGKPALHGQGHAAMPTCLGHVEKTLVLVSGPGAGSSLSPRMLATDASLISWGVVMSGPPARGLTSEGRPYWGKGVVHRILRCPSLLGALGRLACQPCWCFRAQRSPASPHLSLPPGNVAELGSSPPLWGSLQQLVRLSPAGHPLQDTELAAHTRGQSRETGSLSRLFGSVETTAKCICLGPVHCRVRLLHSIWCFAATFLRDLHCGEPRAGSGNGTGRRPLRRSLLMSRSPGSTAALHSPPAFERAGVETERQEECAVSIIENHLSRCGVGFDHDAGTFVTCSVRSILTAVTRVKEGRSLTVKQSQRLLGLMAAASNVIPFGLLYMRPRQWWLRTKGFSPRGSSFCMIKVTRQCLRALDMWKKPWFLSQGPVLGAPCRRVTLATDVSLTGWGAVMSGHPARGLWSSRHLTWHISCLEMLAVFRALKHFLPDLIGHHVLVRTDNTAVDKLLLLRAVHVPGHLNMGADILSRQGLRPGEWMLHPPWGLDAMVQMWPRLRLYAFPLIALLPGAGVLEFVAPGLSTEVVETILQSRAPSSRKLYALKWKPFTSWCGDCQQDSVNCPVGTVLRFLQVRFSTGLAHSTLKVYVAAILAYHAPLGGSSVCWNPLVTRFLRGVLRPRPLARCSLLSVVGMLFHSFESSDLPFLGLCSFTLGRDLKSGGVGISFPKRFDAARVPEGERLSACFSIQKLPAACTARAFQLPGLYVTPPVTSRFSIGLFAHVFQSVVTLEAFPKRFDAASRSLGEPWAFLSVSTKKLETTLLYFQLIFKPVRKV